MASKRLALIHVVMAGVLLGVQTLSIAQSDKQINKAVKIFYKKGYQEGIDKLQSYMQKVRNAGEAPTLSAYETWVQMEYLNYVENTSLFENIEITMEIDSSGESTMDSATVELMNELKSYPKKHFIEVCRKSTIESFSSIADNYLRMFLVDYDPDTAVSEKAKSYFTEGEEFLGKEDYELAELNYRKALNEDSTYYKAYLSLGYSFWARADQDSAIVYFTMAKNLCPDLLEPRKHIIDALIEQGLYYRARKECLEAFTVYPGFDVKWRFQEILGIENKYMEDHRYIRYFFPNNIKTEDQRELNGASSHYRNAKEEISRYCNEDGIIEPNSKTSDVYLEVYSFRSMFENVETGELPEYMEFGHKMMEEGYLEPYVFISMFHVDIYPQFKHYMSFPENREKSIEYIDKYLIETYPD